MTATAIEVERKVRNVLEDVPLGDFQIPCPHCRTLGSIRDAECPSCGLIYAKWRKRDVAPATTPTRDPRTFWGSRARAMLMTGAVGVVLALGAAVASTAYSVGELSGGPCGCSLVDR